MNCRICEEIVGSLEDFDLCCICFNIIVCLEIPKHIPIQQHYEYINLAAKKIVRERRNK
jgi:hypothetical protein